MIVKEINHGTFPGVGPKNLYVGEAAKKISIPLKYKDSKTELHPSTSGRLVKCDYYLEVTPIFGGWCTRNIASFSVGLKILQQGLMISEPPKPDNWNPEVFKKSTIILNQNQSNENLNQMTGHGYY